MKIKHLKKNTKKKIIQNNDSNYMTKSNNDNIVINFYNCNFYINNYDDDMEVVEQINYKNNIHDNHIISNIQGEIDKVMDEFISKIDNLPEEKPENFFFFYFEKSLKFLQSKTSLQHQHYHQLFKEFNYFNYLNQLTADDVSNIYISLLINIFYCCS